MRIDIITLFPGMLTGFLSESMIGRARERGLVAIEVHDLRKWGAGKWQITDDRPFGGGAGMLMKPEPLCAAIDTVRDAEAITVYLTPDGERFNHAMAVELAKAPHLVLVSGHYEGIDQRVRDSRIDREVSIGDFVLTNGTLPAAVLVDAVARQIPGVLGTEKSLTQDSFQNNVLGFPFIFRGALDVRARTINDEMKLAASHALAALAKEPVPEDVLRVYGLDQLKFGPDYVVPKPFDKRVCLWVAPAVAKAAMASGVASNSIDSIAYREALKERLKIEV